MLISNGVTSLTWKEGSSELSWVSGSSTIRVTHDAPVGHAIALKDGSGVVVVEDLKGSRKDNAVVLNADGGMRFRVINPLTYRDDDRFYYATYEGDELIIVLASAVVDRACIIDQQTGRIVRSHETR